MKTLRTFIAEAIDDMVFAGIGPSEAAMLVEDAVVAVRDWLAQDELLAIIASETPRLSAAGLRAEAVK